MDVRLVLFFFLTTNEIMVTTAATWTPFSFSAKEEAKQEQMEREGVNHAILDQMVKQQLASVVYSLSDDW